MISLQRADSCLISWFVAKIQLMTCSLEMSGPVSQMCHGSALTYRTETGLWQNLITEIIKNWIIV